VVLRLIVFGSEVPLVQRDTLGVAIYRHLQLRYPHQVIMGTIETQPLLTAWQQEVTND